MQFKKQQSYAIIAKKPKIGTCYMSSGHFKTPCVGIHEGYTPNIHNMQIIRYPSDNRFVPAERFWTNTQQFSPKMRSRHLPVQGFWLAVPIPQSLLQGLSSSSSRTWFTFARTLTLLYGDYIFRIFIFLISSHS